MPPRVCCPSAAGVRILSRQQPSSQWFAVLIANSLISATSSSKPRTTCEWPSCAPSSRAALSTSSRKSASSGHGSRGFALPKDYISPTQPPSARSPDIHKSQLLRSYTALVRSTPLFLIFQHNNITGEEWEAVRRELSLAIAMVPSTTDAVNRDDTAVNIASNVKLQVIRTGIFRVALRIVEFFDRSIVTSPPGGSPLYTHDLSKAVYAATNKKVIESGDIPDSSTFSQLSPLLLGPLAVLSFPTVSPAQLAAALSILSPSKAFPAPSKKKRPGYFEPLFQAGIKKLLLVGGRLESVVLDEAGIIRVGSIEGGIDGLRAQLVALLQSAGMGVTATLEGAGKSLWLTMEGRREMLEEKKDDGVIEKEAVQATQASESL